MKIQFNSEAELYQLVLAALRIKMRELSITNLTEYGIWTYLKKDDIEEFVHRNYLKKEKWKYQTGLTLAKMVHDILEVKQEEITKYWLEK